MTETNAICPENERNESHQNYRLEIDAPQAERLRNALDRELPLQTQEQLAVCLCKGDIVDSADPRLLINLEQILGIR